MHAAASNADSDQTIDNRLHRGSTRSSRPAVRPPLTLQSRRAARLARSRRHLPWTKQERARVRFAGESRFTQYFNDGRARVWRCQGDIDHSRRVCEGALFLWQRDNPDPRWFRTEPQNTPAPCPRECDRHRLHMTFCSSAFCRHCRLWVRALFCKILNLSLIHI